MKRAPWPSLTALLLLAASGRAAPAPDAPSPLSWVPAAAPAVFHVHGVERLLDHEIALFENVSPERAADAERVKAQLLRDGDSDHRVVKGLKKDGPVFLVCMTPVDKVFSDDPPRVAFIAAVDDYKAFRDGVLTEKERKALRSEDGVDSTTIEIPFILDKIKLPLYFVDRKDHVVVTLRPELARDFLKKRPGLDETMTPSQAARFLAADFAAYLSVDVYSRDYPDQVKAARQAVEDALKAAVGSADPTRQTLAVIGRRTVAQAFQAAEDGRGILLTEDLRPDGIAVHVETEFRPGAATAKLLEGSHLSEFKDLKTLPAGRFLYVGVESSPALSRLLDATLDDPDAKESRKIRDALDALTKAGPGTRLTSYGLPPAGLDVERCDDAAKAVAARLDLAEAVGAGLLLPAGVLKEKPEVKRGAAKYKGFEVHSIRLTWDGDALAAAMSADTPDPSGMAQRQSAAALKKLLGDGTTLWLGTDGKTVFQVAAPEWADAEKKLDAHFRGEGTIGDDAAFAEMRQALPAEANITAVLDAAQYEVAFADVLKPLRDAYAPGMMWKLPPADAHGFVGLAVTLRPERAAADLFVSADALRYAHPWTFVRLMPWW